MYLTTKQLASSLALAGLALMAAGANAALVVEDHFLTGANAAGGEYNVAVLNGQGPTISGMTGNWLEGSNAEVVGTGLDYADATYIAESGGAVQVPGTAGNGRQGRLLTSPITGASTGTVYLSFLMQTDTNDPGSYRAFELHDGGFSDGANRQFQLGFQNGDFLSGGTNYGFRISQTDVKNQLGVNDGAANLFVLKFDLSATGASDAVTVWHNPNLTTGDDPTGGVVVSGQDISFDRITFAKFGDSNGAIWDELRVGDTFTDVTGAVPEPGSLALLSLGGLLIARRRRG